MQTCLCPADVICLSRTNGEVRPLRIRTEEGAGEILVGNVSEIMATRKNRLMGGEVVTFLCRVCSEGAMIVLELKFYKRTHSWFVCRPHI